MEVNKLNIGIIVFYFVFYIVVHLLIGLAKKKLYSEQDNLNNEEHERYKKMSTFLFNWFPAFYIIFLIIVFYLQ